jgi:DNA-binding transcriptional MerR regulator
MEPSLTIGDFARATHMSIKTLRHYHRVGLLEPAQVDAGTGYRRYAVSQIPTAQVIRRFRALDTPLDDIRAVITADDLGVRNDLIAVHLKRLEGSLARTQASVASLRDLLQSTPSAPPGAITHRTVAATPAAAISEVIDVADAMAWYQGAIGELRASLAAQHAAATGFPAGIFATELFTHERGEATIFIPTDSDIRPIGRITALVTPAVELAIIEHVGGPVDIDRAYGSLAAYVTRHALGVEGPLREHYVIDREDTPDQSRWRTQIGWPIFRTDAPRSDPSP